MKVALKNADRTRLWWLAGTPAPDGYTHTDANERANLVQRQQSLETGTDWANAQPYDHANQMEVFSFLTIYTFDAGPDRPAEAVAASFEANMPNLHDWQGTVCKYIEVSSGEYEEWTADGATVAVDAYHAGGAAVSLTYHIKAAKWVQRLDLVRFDDPRGHLLVDGHGQGLSDDSFLNCIATYSPDPDEVFDG